MTKSGSIDVIGFGPGSKEDMTFRAAHAIEQADLVVGYKTYIEILRKFFPEAHYYSTPMTKEIERCEYAVMKALEGLRVAVVSSGDSGIYGMAGIMLEIADRTKGGNEIDIRVVPGITAASSAGAGLGAPLMHDTAIISLSDLMTPLDTIFKRVEAAAASDFVICFYNPRSRKRQDYLDRACKIIERYRSSETPCGVASHVGREQETYIITNLADLPREEIDMFSVVIIGNSQTKIMNGKLVTPRGYEKKYLDNQGNELPNEE
ncbi:MAG: precorrin-3B C(17)-methyltransferase [Fastidiosipilaceae bacterium]|jgi:precorrin-3B C17-methyltransferase|nr:precorrin-3B C(17)-methyltransferase [Clostridiaceae bacterium]